MTILNHLSKEHVIVYGLEAPFACRAVQLQPSKKYNPPMRAVKALGKTKAWHQQSECCVSIQCLLFSKTNALKLNSANVIAQPNIDVVRYGYLCACVGIVKRVTPMNVACLGFVGF